MKNNLKYYVKLPLYNNGEHEGEIAFASCACPAGKGPRGSGKHIAALCYALEEFVRLKRELKPKFNTFLYCSFKKSKICKIKFQNQEEEYGELDENGSQIGSTQWCICGGCEAMPTDD